MTDIKIIFDAATFWLGNDWVYSIDKNLEQKPTLQNLAIWTVNNIIYRYKIIDFLEEKKILLEPDDKYFIIGAMSFAVNLLLGEPLAKNIKVCGIGVVANILTSKLVFPAIIK